jgi:hypothetical protein
MKTKRRRVKTLRLKMWSEGKGPPRTTDIISGGRLARVGHAPVHGSLSKKRLVSAQAEDDEGHSGEAHVKLDLTEENRSSFENFDPRS